MQRKTQLWTLVVPALLAALASISWGQETPDDVTKDEKADPLKLNLPFERFDLPATAQTGQPLSAVWQYAEAVRDDQAFALYQRDSEGQPVILLQWVGKGRTSHVIEFGSAGSMTIGIAEVNDGELMLTRGEESVCEVTAGPPPAGGDPVPPPPPPGPPERETPPADPAPVTSRNNPPRNLIASVSPGETLDSGEVFHVNFRFDDDRGDSFTSALCPVAAGKKSAALPDDDATDYSIACVAPVNSSRHPMTVSYNLTITDAGGASIEAEFSLTVNPAHVPPPDLPAGSVRLTLRRPSPAAEARGFRERNGEPEPTRGTASYRPVMRDGRLFLVPDEDLTPAERERLRSQYRRTRR